MSVLGKCLTEKMDYRFTQRFGGAFSTVFGIPIGWLEIVPGILMTPVMVLRWTAFIFLVYRGRQPFSYVTHNNSVRTYGLHSLVPTCSTFTHCFKN